MGNNLHDWCIENDKVHLLSEWDTENNAPLTPEQISPKKREKVWWKCKYGHQWAVTIWQRTYRKTGCPYCAGKKAITGVNDLATLAPNLAAEWHPTKNEGLKPSDMACRSAKKVWWKCNQGHEWSATINNRSCGTGCPICSNARKSERLSQYPVKRKGALEEQQPLLAAQWHPVKNEGQSPSEVAVFSNKRAWWLCPDCGHEWSAVIASRSNGRGCPKCGTRRRKPRKSI